MTIRRLAGALLFSSLVLACGGRVEDPPQTHAGRNAPANATTKLDACRAACGALAACVPSPRFEADCVRHSCEESFSTVAQVNAFMECVLALPCSEIERSLAMDYGPIGECTAEAQGR